MATRVRSAGFWELDVGTLYALLRLRVDAFVVEQRCSYPELDGRDTEPGARHWWVEEQGEALAYLRTLPEAEGSRVGRVVTAQAVRGHGYAAALMRAALPEVDRPIVLGAQAHLADWYARFGFDIDGPPYDEDGIPHVPMRLDEGRGR